MLDIVEHILDTTLKEFRYNCPSDITDKVFIEIQKEYMYSYENECRHRGTHATNTMIGKHVRYYWGLKNLGRCNSPRSSLITSYEMHKN